MRIILYGTDSTANLGDQAILLSMMEALERVFAGARFTILTEHPDLARQRVGGRAGVERIGRLPRLWPAKKTTGRLIASYALARAFARAPWLAVGRFRANRQATRWIAESDLLVLVGGRYLTSPYFSTLLGVLWAVQEARRRRVPVVAYSQSIGPFVTIKEKVAAQHLLRGLELAMARDGASFEFLKHFAVPGLRVEAAPDCVFNLRPAEAAAVNEAMEREGIDEDRRPLVALTARMLHVTIEKYAPEEEGRYAKLLARVADALFGDGAQLVFLSSTYRAGSYGRHDPDIARTFRALMRNPDALRIVEREYPVEVLKGMYGRMDLVISTRMHPTILAGAMGVPVAALAYEYKGVEVMELMGLGEYAVKVREATAEGVIELARRALVERERIRAGLRRRIPEIQERALAAAQYVREAYERYRAGKR